LRQSNQGYLVLPTFGTSAEAAGAVDVLALLDFEASVDAAMLPVLVAFALCVVVFLVDFLVDLVFLWLGWVDAVALLVLVPVSAFAAGAGAAAGVAAAGAAVCLAVTWRAKRWLPPIALASAIVVDHYTTLALRHMFHRIGPPTSPLGTYPSGGVDRCVVFYGLIAYLLWREFSGQRRAAIWAGAAVAAVSFSEAYSRVYLSLHWFTDALSGLLYGALLLIVFIIAVRAVTGAPSTAAAPSGGEGVAVPAGVPPTGGTAV